ncbi:Sec20-domain-containing protein [Coprinopsis sp. MPI-PUGE-AT-0042]|nr:Sec20-domain-containing protein [Coprinopsis sp. MPI-PUGE-AT-0042]
MAPVPTKLTDDARNLIETLERRQRHFSETQIPALNGCKGPLSLQQELADELRDDLGVYSRQIDTLDVMVDDQKGERARSELRSVVETYKSSLNDLRTKMRAAVLYSKKTIDSMKRSNRDELFQSAGISEKEKQAQMGNEKVGDDALMKANADVTDALRRTIESMQAELERSVLSNQLLETSTAALKATSTQHDALSTAMETTKYIVTALEKSDWMDRVLIISAFVFFLLVVLFILKQRFIDRGIRMMLWWTKFVPDFSGDDKLLKAEEGWKSAVTAVSTAAASTVTTLLSSTSSIPTASLDTVETPSTEVSSTLSIALLSDTPRTTGIVEHEEL